MAPSAYGRRCFLLSAIYFRPASWAGGHHLSGHDGVIITAKSQPMFKVETLPEKEDISMRLELC